MHVSNIGRGAAHIALPCALAAAIASCATPAFATADAGGETQLYIEPAPSDASGQVRETARAGSAATGAGTTGAGAAGSSASGSGAKSPQTGDASPWAAPAAFAATACLALAATTRRRETRGDGRLDSSDKEGGRDGHDA